MSENNGNNGNGGSPTGPTGPVEPSKALTVQPAAGATVEITRGGEVAGIGFHSIPAFEGLQRMAKVFTTASLTPKEYQGNLANCMIALNMAIRMRADPLMVMGNGYIVHGKFGWSAQFLIASFNQCGRFASIAYRWNTCPDCHTDAELKAHTAKMAKDASLRPLPACKAHGPLGPMPSRGTVGDPTWGVQAYSRDLSTGLWLPGPWVTLAMATAEKWIERNPKWTTMPQLMMTYRAASFLVKTTAPELTMGLQTKEELEDIPDDTFRAPVAAANARDVTPRGNGTDGPAASPEQVADVLADAQAALKATLGDDE